MKRRGAAIGEATNLFFFFFSSNMIPVFGFRQTYHSRPAAATSVSTNTKSRPNSIVRERISNETTLLVNFLIKADFGNWLWAGTLLEEIFTPQKNRCKDYRERNEMNREFFCEVFPKKIDFRNVKAAGETRCENDRNSHK